MAEKTRPVDLLGILAKSAENLPVIEQELRYALVATEDNATCVLVGSLLGLIRECTQYLALYEEVVSGAYENASVASEEARVRATVLTPLAQSAREFVAKAGAESQLTSIVSKAWRAWCGYEKENFGAIGRERSSCR